MIYFNRMWKALKDNRNTKSNIREVEYSDINLNEYTIIDVRSRREFRETHINGSINIPLPEVKRNIGRYVKDKNRKLLICCQSGIRSARAVGMLEEMGYAEAYNLKGGIENI